MRVSQKTHPQRSYGERIFVAVIGLVFAGQFGLALSYPADPRLFPMIIAGAGMLLTLAILFVPSRGQPLPDKQETVDDDAHEPSVGCSTIVALIVPPLYALGLWALGFWIVTVLTIPAVAILLGYRNRLVIALVTLALVLAVGFLFPLVNIAMPKSALFGQYLSF